MNKKVLILGGHGFVGFYILNELINKNYNVRCLVRNLPREAEQFKNVEYVVGDVFEDDTMDCIMNDIDAVYYFISTSMPNSNISNLENEFDFTLKALDRTLVYMVKKKVNYIVFPSSGGAIYGNETQKMVDEKCELHPVTPYGVGKQLSEQIIQYYNTKYGINASIFRIGNVYGSKQFRSKPQGVIDVFVQSALLNKSVSVWGKASETIRDYIYLDDVASAIVEISARREEGVNVYNVGTGVGISLKNIIEEIENVLEKKMIINYVPQKISGINCIILDSSKLWRTLEREPITNIRLGIEKTVKNKQKILNL